MAISKGSATERETCCFTLAVEHYDAQKMECIVYEGNQEQGYCCHSFIGLARQMEQGFEKMDYPTPSVLKRQFAAFGSEKGKDRRGEGCMVPDRRDGRLGTFLIRVKQCFYATWQGQVCRAGNEKDGVLFRNFLEFAVILDEMLSGTRALEMTDGRSMVDSLADALLFAGRYNGIWVEEQPSAEVLICGRNPKDSCKETFAVRPMFRENHTFQGSVSWMEGRQQKNFRSFLELLFLIMSAEGKQAKKENDM